MTKCDGKPYSELILTDNLNTNLKQLISNNSEKFLEYIQKLGLQLEHKAKTVNMQNISTTIITLKTTCFKVDFNDTFVKLSPLK